jgi:hypothetical protein
MYARSQRERHNELEKEAKKANPARYLLRAARYRASLKDAEFHLRESDIHIPDVCPILGIKLFYSETRSPNTPSLDRKNNEKGYVPGNVQVISFRANTLKNDASIEELEKVLNWMKSQEGLI